jgi:hypothetical protein
MALITRFRQVEKSRATLHEPVTCRPVRLAVASGWSILDTPGGRVLQLDTYGSEERELQGSSSPRSASVSGTRVDIHDFSKRIISFDNLRALR